MEVIEIREVSRSRDGMRREVVIIGKGDGRRFRGASRTTDGQKPRRLLSVTRHQHKAGSGWTD